MSILHSAIWRELSPTHHNQLQRIIDGTAPPAVLLRFRDKYAVAVARQAHRTGRRVGFRNDTELDDAVQTVVLEYLHMLDTTHFQPDGGESAFRRYLCAMIRNQMHKFIRETARSSTKLNKLLGLEAVESKPDGTCVENTEPARISRELEPEEYQAVLRASLDEWAAQHPTGALREVYDALVGLHEDPSFDPNNESIDETVALRTGQSVGAVKKSRYRIRQAVQVIRARNVLRRLLS